jgi:hypothetical protein
MHSRKYHGKECGCRKLRLLVLMPQLDVAELESNENDKEEDNCSRTDKQPSEVEGDFATPIDEGAVRSFRAYRRGKDNRATKKVSDHERSFLDFLFERVKRSFKAMDD